MSQVTRTISANSGDCWANKASDGGFDNTSDFIYIGGGTGLNMDLMDWIGFTLPLAQGAQIVSATLRLIPTATWGTGVDGTLCCEAIDNSVTPTTNAAVRAKVQTTAENNVSYGIWTQGVAVDLDFTNSVQEVLNRAGWVAGNQIGILIKDITTGNNNRREAATTRNVTYNPPQLLVTYNYFVPQGGLL